VLRLLVLLVFVFTLLLVLIRKISVIVELTDVNGNNCQRLHRE
jgi:hypothetical protein